MSQYRDQMNSGMEDAKSRLREGMDSARSAASEARDYVNTKMHDARDTMSHMGEQARERFEAIRDTDYDEMWEGMKGRVRENPGPALLIAGAVGLAIGVLLAGSSAAATHRRRF